ncbi:MAG: glycine cleavage system protein GcvH [Actinomycetes bacterium]
MAEASYPEELLYHQEHDWVKIDEDGETATMGITWYAQDALGEVVFFDAPQVGDTVTQDESYAEIESVKAVSEVIAPMSGEVIEVNGAIADDPAVVNEDPYSGGWLVKVRLSSVEERNSLMDSAAYTAMLG